MMKVHGLGKGSIQANARILRCFALLLAIVSLGVVPQAFAQSAVTPPFGVYRLFSQGSARVMAMGGTSAATVDDATASRYNPAGAALAKWRFDFGATNNRIDDRTSAQEASYASFGAGNQAYSFIQYAAAARLGPLVFGIGLSTPYQYMYSDYLLNASILLVSYDAMLAWRVSENFSVGVSGHFENLKERILQQGSEEAEATGSAVAVSAGALYRTKKGGVGAVYFQGHDISLGTVGSKSSPVASWLRNVTVPSSSSFGGFYRVKENFLLAVDVNRVEVPRNLVDASSGLNYVGDVGLVTGTQQIVHGGFEWTLLSDRHMNLIFRGGGYVEPARIVAGESRLHRTYGLEVQFGPAVLTVSFDQATNFSNTSQGFSLVLGAI